MKTCEVMETKGLCGKQAVKRVKLTYSSIFLVCQEHLRDFRRDQVVEKEWRIDEETTKETNPGTEGRSGN